MAEAEYLDPEVLSRVGNLELIAKWIVEGFLSGRHRSPFHGFSVEYADHRPYTPGDELRSLDWKLLARSDKYYVKLFEDETNLRAHLVLDASRSMNYTSGGLTKFRYAALLGAAIAHLLLRQSDAAGLVVFDDQIRHFLPARSSNRQFRRILMALGETVSERETSIGPVLHELAERVPRRGLVVILSDCLDDLESLAGGLQHLRHRGHEVLLMQILDPAEMDFPFERRCRFRDIEGGSTVDTDPRAAKALYHKRLEAFLDALQLECHKVGVTHCLGITSEAYDRFLGSYLEKRARVG